jgi:hypothetical protein
MSPSEFEDSLRHTLRLRTMVESWERDGLICADIAARALSPEREHPGRGTRAQRRRGPMLWLGRLVAARGDATGPMRAAGPKTHEVLLNDRSARQVVRAR